MGLSPPLGFVRCSSSFSSSFPSSFSSSSSSLPLLGYFLSDGKNKQHKSCKTVVRELTGLNILIWKKRYKYFFSFSCNIVIKIQHAEKAESS